MEEACILGAAAHANKYSNDVRHQHLPFTFFLMDGTGFSNDPSIDDDVELHHMTIDREVSRRRRRHHHHSWNQARRWCSSFGKNDGASSFYVLRDRLRKRTTGRNSKEMSGVVLSRKPSLQKYT